MSPNLRARPPRGLWSYLIASGWVAMALLLGFVFDVRWSAGGVAALCIVFAITRGLGWPWFLNLPVRGRRTDVVVLLTSAILLIGLVAGIPV